MDIESLFNDYNIYYQTEGHKHCREGWINIECPFCTGNPGLHLGYDIQSDLFNCWRCGGKSIVRVISKLLNINNEAAKKIIGDYGGKKTRIKATNKIIKIRTKGFKFPSDTTPLLKRHKKYLEKRNFDPDKIEKEWGLLSTGPMSQLDKRDYRHRIIAPIIWDKKIVSFQGRDVTNKSSLKYKACPKDRELIQHQEILYCNQELLTDFGVGVEGITDVWRFGPKYAFGVFGIDYTPFQVRQIITHFKKVAIVFDDDPQAIKQAKKLVAELCFRGLKAWYEIIKGDPADMQQQEADKFLKYLIKKAK